MVENSLDDWFVEEILPLEPALIRFLQRNWRNEAEVNDLLQETYVRVYDAAKRNRPALAKPFLFQVARFLMIDLLRRQSVVSFENMADIDWFNIPDESPSCDVVVDARQELRLLQTALDRLPPRCRQVIWLRKVVGLPPKEVAARMQISVDTVEGQVAKGIEVLTRALDGRRAAVTAQSRRFNFLRKTGNVG